MRRSRISSPQAHAVIAAMTLGSLTLSTTSASADPYPSGPDNVQCGDQVLTIQSHPDRGSVIGSWSSAKILGGGSGQLIPTLFTLSAWDDTVKAPVPLTETQVKGAGNGNGQRSGKQVTCTETQTATLAALLKSGEYAPPGGGNFKDTDTVTITVTVDAVWRP